MTYTAATTVLPEYNGWTNYPTWNAMFWLNNQEVSHRDLCAFAATNPDTNDIRAYVMRYIKGHDNYKTGCATDIQEYGRHYGLSLLAMMGRIDYAAIAETLREDHATATAD